VEFTEVTCDSIFSAVMVSGATFLFIPKIGLVDAFGQNQSVNSQKLRRKICQKTSMSSSHGLCTAFTDKTQQTLE